MSTKCWNNLMGHYGLAMLISGQKHHYIPWLLAWPSHQQPWYWPYKMRMFSSCSKVNLNNICVSSQAIKWNENTCLCLNPTPTNHPTTTPTPPNTSSEKKKKKGNCIWACGRPGSLLLRLLQWPGGRFKNTYELLNLRVLKISMLYKNHIFQCMGKIFCVEFQREPLKFHAKYLTHTLNNVDFIHIWKFKSSQI